MYTVRLPNYLDNEISSLLEKSSNKSEFIREALIQYIKREKFKKLRSRTLPFAEAQGFLTDEDVFENL
ncbi:CopG family transcriptional regulator [Candidatus Margulisiibacteriota bacterium]